MSNMKPRKLKIVEPGLERYTGPIGSYNFVDGLSEHPVGYMEAQRIGAAMRVEDADEEGFQVSPAANMYRVRDVPADDPEVLAFGKTVEVDGKAVAINERFTREQLEGIADKKGLAGLREIATRWSASARSINDMIDRIIEAQTVIVAEVTQAAE
jgi:hypothetical protein